MRGGMSSWPMTFDALVPRTILTEILHSCCRLRGWSVPEEKKRGESWGKAVNVKTVQCSGALTCFHKTWGRCEPETRMWRSRRVFCPGCRWRTRQRQTSPTARSCQACRLELRGAKPSRGTSLNWPWHLQKGCDWESLYGNPDQVDDLEQGSPTFWKLRATSWILSHMKCNQFGLVLLK